MVQKLSVAEMAMQERASERYDSIMNEHRTLPKDTADRKKRLVYRSKQRGWLEVDLLLGTWARENVGGLSDSELDLFEEFVNEETIDIYNILTLRTDIPQRLGNNEVVKRIQQWAMASPLGKADKEMYRKIKTENNLI